MACVMIIFERNALNLRECSLVRCGAGGGRGGGDAGGEHRAVLPEQAGGAVAGGGRCDAGGLRRPADGAWGVAIGPNTANLLDPSRRPKWGHLLHASRCCCHSTWREQHVGDVQVAAIAGHEEEMTWWDVVDVSSTMAPLAGLYRGVEGGLSTWCTVDASRSLFPCRRRTPLV